MATSYDVVFKPFYEKIKGDKLYFIGTDPEIESQSIELLKRAINIIYKYGNPDFNFYNTDDSLKQFNEDLVPQEVELLADLMYEARKMESKNLLDYQGLTFTSKELNIFSPANERDSVIKMINGISQQNVGSINNYLARDRVTWKYKSMYGGV